MLSEKQYAFLKADDKRLNILSGSVRSGKTYVSLLKFALTVANTPLNYEFLMAGKTITTLKRNCLGLLYNLVGDGLQYSLSQKQGTLCGHKLYFEGANDERSESKIRGMTLGGAYIDELTQIPESFYGMLLSRLSLPGAKLYATTNPDSPNHYVKAKILDNEELDLANWHFVIDDNTFLDKEFVENQKTEHTGVFYDRFILGKWVVAEGLVYPMFNKAFHVVMTEARPYERYWISADYGTANPCVFSLWGLSAGVYYLADEYYHDGRKDGQRTDDEHYAALERLAGKLKISQVFIDPSAASFIELIRRRGRFTVIKANNAVIDGIRECGTALSKGLVKFNDCCEKSIAEFGLYSWDEKSREDRPVKEFDHFCDSFRYFWHTLHGKEIKIISKGLFGGRI
jgi:PBSX family phage terminase large subunit